MSSYTILTELYAASSYSVHSSLGDESSSRSIRNKYTLRPVVVNPDFVVSIREDVRQRDPTQLPEDLDDRHSFCRVTLRSGMNDSYLTVVGDLRTIAQKIWGKARE